MRHLAPRLKPFLTALALLPLLMLVGCAPNYGTNYTPPPKLLDRLSGHGFWVESVTWSPGGKLLASASTDMSVRIWDVASKQTIHQLTFPGSVTGVTWSPDNKYLATISAEPGDDVDIWDTTTWYRVAHMNPSEDATRVALPGIMAWSPDGKYMATDANGYSDTDIGRVKVYDTSTWEVAMVQDVPTGAGDVAWSPDGVNIAFGSSTAPLGGGASTLNIWNVQTNKLTTWTDPEQNEYGFTAWSPDGQYIAEGPAGKDYSQDEIAIWDVKAGQKIQTLKGHSSFVTSIAWSPDSKKLASGSYDMTAIIWDAASGQALESFKHSDIVLDVAWSPDGTILATACADSLVYVWDAK
jgi:WD40 repeat protein